MGKLRKVIEMVSSTGSPVFGKSIPLSILCPNSRFISEAKISSSVFLGKRWKKSTILSRDYLTAVRRR
jgi:hypothetical protein